MGSTNNDKEGLKALNAVVDRLNGRGGSILPPVYRNVVAPNSGAPTREVVSPRETTNKHLNNENTPPPRGVSSSKSLSTNAALPTAAVMPVDLESTTKSNKGVNAEAKPWEPTLKGDPEALAIALEFAKSATRAGQSSGPHFAGGSRVFAPATNRSPYTQPKMVPPTPSHGGTAGLRTTGSGGISQRAITAPEAVPERERRPYGGPSTDVLSSVGAPTVPNAKGTVDTSSASASMPPHLRVKATTKAGTAANKQDNASSEIVPDNITGSAITNSSLTADKTSSTDASNEDAGDKRITEWSDGDTTFLDELENAARPRPKNVAHALLGELFEKLMPESDAVDKEHEKLMAEHEKVMAESDAVDKEYEKLMAELKDGTIKLPFEKALDLLDQTRKENFALIQENEQLKEALEKRNFLGVGGDDEPFAIKVDCPDGSLLRVQVTRNTTIGTLIRRACCQAQKNWSFLIPRMLFNGEAVAHLRTVAECGITKDCTVHIKEDYDGPYATAIPMNPIPTQTNPFVPKKASMMEAMMHLRMGAKFCTDKDCAEHHGPYANAVATMRDTAVPVNPVPAANSVFAAVGQGMSATNGKGKTAVATHLSLVPYESESEEEEL